MNLRWNAVYVFALFMTTGVAVAQDNTWRPIESIPSLNQKVEEVPLLTEEWMECPPQLHNENFWIRGEAVAFMFLPTKILGLAGSSESNTNSEQLLTKAKSLFSLYDPIGSNRSGYKISGGWWADQEKTVGLEFSYTRLDVGANTLIFNPNNGSIPLEFSRLISVPVTIGRFSRIFYVPITIEGAFTANSEFTIVERNHQDFQAMGRMLIYETEDSRMDALFGYRRITHDDQFQIRSTVSTIFDRFIPGTELRSTDDVATQNTYDGAILGINWERHFGPWRIDFRPKVSVLYWQRSVTRDGSTTATFTDGFRLFSREGTYTLNSEIGTTQKSSWTVVPEIDFQISRSFGENIRVFAGLSGTYFPEMAMSINQLSLGISPDRVAPGETADAPSAITNPVSKPILLSTASLGIEFRY